MTPASIHTHLFFLGAFDDLDLVNVISQWLQKQSVKLHIFSHTLKRGISQWLLQTPIFNSEMSQNPPNLGPFAIGEEIDKTSPLLLLLRVFCIRKEERVRECRKSLRFRCFDDHKQALYSLQPSQ